MYVARNHLLITAGAALLAGTLMLTPAAGANGKADKPAAPAVSPTDRVAAVEAAMTVGLAYRQWNQATNGADGKAFSLWAERYHSSDFTFKKLDGKSENSQGLAALWKLNTPARKKIHQLTVNGGTAIATVTCGPAGTPTDGQEKTNSRLRQQRDTWVKTSQGWKIKSSEELRDREMAKSEKSSCPS